MTVRRWLCLALLGALVLSLVSSLASCCGLTQSDLEQMAEDELERQKQNLIDKIKQWFLGLWQSFLDWLKSLRPRIPVTPPSLKPRSLQIGIEAGHGNGDSGAHTGGKTCIHKDRPRVEEQTITLAVAQLAAQILRERGHQVDVFRDDDGDITTRPKSEIAGYRADAFIALHTDYCADGNTGFKVSRYGGEAVSGKDESEDASDRLVDALWAAYGAATGLPEDDSAGHFTKCMTYYSYLNPTPGGLVGIRPPNKPCKLVPGQAWIHAETPGAIIEMGWLSGDLDFMTSLEGQRKMAQGIVDAVEQLYGGGNGEGEGEQLKPPIDAPPSSLHPGMQAVVVNTGGKGLNCRPSPGLGQDPLEKLPDGTVVTIIDGPVQEGEYTWWQVEPPSHRLCWAAENWLAPLDTVTPHPSGQEYDSAFLTDQQLVDYSSMGADQIRDFLVSQGSYYQRPVEDIDGTTFDPPEVIAQAARMYRINPQVLLATLQKESSAVSSGKPGNKATLMGCGPDRTTNIPEPVDTARGQLYCAAERFRAYHDELANTGTTRSGWQVGVAKDTVDGVRVTPATRAVAGQFTYTPYAGSVWGGQSICEDGPCGGVYLFYDAWHRFGFGE
jgi:N-acetylmuramoyl-L-alanine amidase